MMVVDIICTVIIVLALVAVGIITYKRNVANKYFNLPMWRNFWIMYWALCAVSVLCIVHNFVKF